MRNLYLLLCLAVLAAGAIFGALNPQAVTVDMYFSSVELRLGLGLLLASLAGALLGGLCVWAGVVLPLRRRLGRSLRDSKASASEPPPPALVDESRA